jgi:orotidine-5'-phosphate decarboxylase
MMKELILALDVMNEKKALDIAERVRDSVDRIKVNYPLVLSSGIQIIGKLSSIKPVIADFKIADIPYTSSLIAEAAFRAGAEAVIAHGFCGSDMLKALLEVSERYNGEIYVVTELSSSGGQQFMAAHSVEIARMARELGCHGLIAPATRVDRISKIRDVAGRLKIYSPGVGYQGGSLEALRYADGIIVGRSIYLADNPEFVAAQLRRRIHEVDW